MSWSAAYEVICPSVADEHRVTPTYPLTDRGLGQGARYVFCLRRQLINAVGGIVILEKKRIARFESDVLRPVVVERQLAVRMKETPLGQFPSHHILRSERPLQKHRQGHH